MRSDSSRSHFVALDSMRGLAATNVVLLHQAWTWPLAFAPIVLNGYLMVDFFFVLSGFVISYGFSNKLERVSDLGQFIWLRFWRLYPLHFFMLIAFLGIEVVRLYFAMHHNFDGDTAPFSVNNGPAFVANLFLVQSLHLFATNTFNVPSWSISTEFYTYIIFGTLVLVTVGRKRMRTAIALVLFIASLTLLLYLVGPLYALGVSSTWGILRCIAGFFLGTLVYDVYVATAKRIGDNPERKKPFDICAILTAFLTLTFLVLKPARNPLDILMLPLASLLVFSSAMSGSGVFNRALGVRPLKWMGKVSYSIYMVHYAVCRVDGVLARQFLHYPKIHIVGQEYTISAFPPLVGLSLSILTVGLTLLIANFTFTFIENPWRKWSKAKLTAAPGATGQVSAVQ